MTIPVKIQCDCGQRYAFDVEPVDGAMPHGIACPACGADGLAAANAVIQEGLAALAEPAAAVAPARMHVEVPKPATRLAVSTASATGVVSRNVAPVRQMDPSQLEHEARAKIFWGDPQEEVVKYLMIHGIGPKDASEMVRAMFLERASAIRKNGISKMVVGSGLVCVPIAAFGFFMHIGILPLKLFALTVMVGLWGAYMLLKGTIMFLAPKSEPGDVADQ